MAKIYLITVGSEWRAFESREQNAIRFGRLFLLSYILLIFFNRFMNNTAISACEHAKRVHGYAQN